MERQRNPGSSHATAPDCAALHPGYALYHMRTYYLSDPLGRVHLRRGDQRVLGGDERQVGRVLRGERQDGVRRGNGAGESVRQGPPAQKLRQQQETFQRDAPVMGAEEKANLERQLRDGARDFERQRNELAEDFNLRQNEEIANLRRDAVMRAQTYAREQKFDLLLLDQTVVFASTAVDITEAVIGKPAAAPARSQ